MIPYCRHQIQDSDRRAVARVLDSPRLTQGPEVGRFEVALAKRAGMAEAVAVSSGTSALQVCLSALGVGPGDEVLVPSLTFLATANAVLLLGARPVFVDVGRETLTLDPEDLARKITPRTRGAIVVHYAGHLGDLRTLRCALGSDRFLVEDACHALGAESEAFGQNVSDAACYSFHPAKHVTTGEGGAVTTSRPDLAQACRELREHGVCREAERWQGLGLPDDLGAEQAGGWVYEMQALSGNHRLPDLGAALGLSQLGRLDEILAERRAIAARYDAALVGEQRVEVLSEAEGTKSAWHLYPIRLAVDAIRGGRAAVYHALHEAGIGVQVHYIPVHLQPYYRLHWGTGYGDLPVTEKAYLSLLSLPLFPGLSESDQGRVVDVLRGTLEALRA